MKFSTNALLLATAATACNAFPHTGGVHQVTAEEDAVIVRLGAVQAETVHWNLSASIDKFCDYMAAAGEANMDIVTFSEGFLSGYPWWHFWTNTFDLDSNAEIQRLFVENSLQVGSEEMRRAQRCVANAGVNVVLPINERDDKGSMSAVFNTVLFIDKSGEIMDRHRKLLPSFTERFWWTQGDGTDLVVVDMPDVGRVCSLLCWESYLLLARYTLMSQGCEFLFVPTQDLGPLWESHISDMGREGRWYVIGQGQLMAPHGEAMETSPIAKIHEQGKLASQWYPEMLEDFYAIGGCAADDTATVGKANKGGGLRARKLQDDQPQCKKFFMDGGVTIADPNGNLLVEGVHSNDPESVKAAREGCVHSVGYASPTTNCEFVPVDGYNSDHEFIVVTNATRGKVLAAKTYQDNVGNYARNDIWKVTWDNAPRDYIFETANTVMEGNSGKEWLSAAVVEEEP